jgi:hypothetical protein
MVKKNCDEMPRRTEREMNKGRGEGGRYGSDDTEGGPACQESIVWWTKKGGASKAGSF